MRTDMHMFGLAGAALIILALLKAEPAEGVDQMQFRITWWGFMAGAVLVQAVCLGLIFQQWRNSRRQRHEGPTP